MLGAEAIEKTQHLVKQKNNKTFFLGLPPWEARVKTGRPRKKVGENVEKNADKLQTNV